MGKIDKRDVENMRAVLKTWAQRNGGELEETKTGFKIYRSPTWGIEIVPENGWAYVHGRRDLANLGTNIETWNELNEAIKRLEKAHQKRIEQQ